MSEKKQPSVWEGFKAFLMRGNVIDLAVAVVIGAAFTNIVNSVVKGIINPLVGAIGTKNLDSYSSCLEAPLHGHRSGTATGIRIMWGSVLGATLSFLITAAVVYFLMVLPMSKYLARMAARQKAKEGAQEVIEVTELEVLKEIRDELVAQRGRGAATLTARPGARAGTVGTPPEPGGGDPGQRTPGRLRGGGAASRRGSASGRRRCRRRCRPARPTRGPCRPRTAGPTDRRRPAPASDRAVRGRGRTHAPRVRRRGPPARPRLRAQGQLCEGFHKNFRGTFLLCLAPYDLPFHPLRNPPAGHHGPRATGHCAE